MASSPLFARAPAPKTGGGDVSLPAGWNLFHVEHCPHPPRLPSLPLEHDPLTLRCHLSIIIPFHVKHPTVLNSPEVDLPHQKVP